LVVKEEEEGDLEKAGVHLLFFVGTMALGKKKLRLKEPKVLGEEKLGEEEQAQAHEQVKDKGQKNHER